MNIKRYLIILLEEDNMNYIRLLASKIGHYTKLADMAMKILTYSIEENDKKLNWRNMGHDKSDIVKMYNDIIRKQKGQGLIKSLDNSFLAPPFSILDMKQPYWRDRSNIWISNGLEGEIGRGLVEGKGQHRNGYSNEGILAGDSSTGGYKVKDGIAVSPFDPTLCEVVYYWFLTQTGRSILDPFAGGPVRGVVAERDGFKYTGIELRKEQVEANRENAKTFDVEPTWICGDCNKLEEHISKDDTYDMIFTCPPYFNLEVYSELPGEISNIDNYAEFLRQYESILKKSVSHLKDNRFVCLVVGNVRNVIKDEEGKKTTGGYFPFVSDTIQIMRRMGLHFYNDMVLSTPLGSAPIRAGLHMKQSRKVEHVHQNLLVFYKGDMKKIREEFREIRIKEMKGMLKKDDPKVEEWL